MLRRVDGHVFRRALVIEVTIHWKKGRKERIWKNQVDEESMKFGLSRKDLICQIKWIVGVNQIATR